jgi:hypothetical protein
VGSSRQAVQKNKNQGQYVVCFLLWQKCWQTGKISGLDRLGIFNLVGSLKLIQSVHRVNWS